MASSIKSLRDRKAGWLFCVLGLIVLFSVPFLTWNRKMMNDSLSLNLGKSFFNDFAISDDNVVLRCHIAIDNPSGKGCSFSILAQSPDDVQSGLLLPGTMTGYAMGSDLLGFKEGEKTKFFEVEFIGKAGCGQSKSDRLLPAQIRFVKWDQENEKP